MSDKKLSVKLGLREKLEKDFGNLVGDMLHKFEKKQDLFMGKRNTFVALEGHPDIPEHRKFQVVESTVQEQLDWFKKYSAEYLDTVLSIEKTNSMGVKAKLVVEGEVWGEYTVLELMRLKSIITGKMAQMFKSLPIRPAGTLWTKTSDPVYAGREVYESTVDTGSTKTTLKRIVVVEDPYIKDAPGRPPVTQPIDTPVNTGNYTRQDFSGAITNGQRAEFEVKLNSILRGIIEAMEEANSVNIVPSDLGGKTLNYLFK